LVYVRALEHIEGFSDHAPILLTTGLPKALCKHQFKFELGLLQCEGFQEMVKNVWERSIMATSLMSHKTRWEIPRGRYDDHSSKFFLSMKPKFNRRVEERNHF
jgi:hypothetical protein